MAQRIAKIELLRRRWANNGSGTFALNMAGYQIAPLDVFGGTVAFLGITNQLLEVPAARLTAADHEGTMLLGVEIDVQLTDSSIYAWSTTEELTSQGYVQSKFPTGTYQETAALPWSPGYVSPLAGDAIGGPATFGIQPSYGQDVQGNATSGLQIKGSVPINALDTGVASPQITCSGSSSGGLIPAGTYAVGLTAHDSGSASHADTGVTIYGLTRSYVHEYRGYVVNNDSPTVGNQTSYFPGVNLPMTAPAGPTVYAPTLVNGIPSAPPAPAASLEWPSGTSARYVWVSFELPTGYVSGSTVNYSISWRSADSSHAATVYLYDFCDITQSPDNPSWYSVSGTTPSVIANGMTDRSYYSGTYTPGACSASNAYYVKMLVDTSAMTSPFDLVSFTLSVQGSL
jgi:hypothetical protein